MSSRTSPFIRRHIFSLFLPVLVLATTGCPLDGGESDVVDSPPATSPSPAPAPSPTFVATTQSVTLSDNSPGIQFIVRPGEDVVIIKFEITSPAGIRYTINGGSETYLKGTTFVLPSTDTAYSRLSGTWRVIVTGYKPGGSGNFTVTKSIDVSA